MTDIVKEQLNNSILELYYRLYRNPWFLVEKKNKKYCLINTTIKINKVTIYNTNLPSSIDKFLEDFARYAVALLIDFFSGYNQIPLAEHCYDLTAFIISVGLVQITILPQGATNSVAQFVYVVNKILEDYILEYCQVFLDNVGIKSPKTVYSNKVVVPGIYRYILEYI